MIQCQIGPKLKSKWKPKLSTQFFLFTTPNLKKLPNSRPALLWTNWNWKSLNYGLQNTDTQPHTTFKPFLHSSSCWHLSVGFFKTPKASNLSLSLSLSFSLSLPCPGTTRTLFLTLMHYFFAAKLQFVCIISWFCPPICFFQLKFNLGIELISFFFVDFGCWVSYNLPLFCCGLYLGLVTILCFWVYSCLELNLSLSSSIFVRNSVIISSILVLPHIIIQCKH